MVDIRTKKELKDLPILDDGQVYIYVMENEIGRIKIGKTTNMQQRYQSLGGSNSQGIKIKYVYCSPATYLYNIENIMHDKFSKYRIPNTEWFQGDDLKYKDVVLTLHNMFKTDNYTRCNEIRKIYTKQNNKEV